MNRPSDYLREEYTLETPESVAFGYEVAGIGSRFIGALIDLIALVTALAAINLLLLLLVGVLGEMLRPPAWVRGLLLAAYALLTFALIWGYFLLFELLWNGQTPGKRLAGIRVVRVDGNPAGLVEVAVRNLVRVVDFLPAFYGIGFVTMFFNRQARRLGDFAAGTIVVKERRDISLASLRPMTAAEPAPEVTARAEALLIAGADLRTLTAADYDLIQETLRRERAGAVSPLLLRRLAGAVAAKIDRPAPAPADARQFLEDVSLLHGQRTAG